MPVSYNNIIDDVMLSMGSIHDDANRGREAILFNVIQVVTKLKKQQLSKHYSVGDARAASDSVSTFIVPLQEIDVDGSVFTDWDSKFFDLPTSVYSLDNDGGINFVRYLRNELPANCPPAVARTPFTGTTLASLNAIYASAYQSPRSDRPYYARARASTPTGIKDRVYVFGVGQGISHVLLGLYAIPNYMTVDPDESIDLPDEYMHTLRKMLLDDAAWLFQIPQERLKNDGRDMEPNQTVQVRPSRSINDPSNADA